MAEWVRIPLSPREYHFGAVVQLVRAPPCQGGSYGFEPRRSANASFNNLTPCKQSPAFEKRLNAEVKKLENRLKFYTPESKEATFLIHEVEATKARFERYSNSNLLCGKEGLPRIIATGQWDHANEFVIPENSFENEIIINVPVALSIITSGFLWPVEAWKQFTTGDLLASEDDVTVSPR
eukprot:gene20081-26077_t